MARSVEAAARARGVDPGGIRRLTDALALSMRARSGRLEDEEHPAYLHPGRTTLILLRDVGLDDGDTLALATLVDTEDVDLRADPVQVERLLGPRAAADLAGLPAPGAEGLVERLLGLTGPLARVSLAERLDQLRHLHLRPELRSVWRDRHEEVVRAWLPFAGRVHEKLATRYRHWERTFARRIDSGQLPRV